MNLKEESFLIFETGGSISFCFLELTIYLLSFLKEELTLYLLHQYIQVNYHIYTYLVVAFLSLFELTYCQEV